MMNESIIQVSTSSVDAYIDAYNNQEDKSIAKVMNNFIDHFFGEKSAQNKNNNNIPLWYQQEKPWRP